MCRAGDRGGKGGGGGERTAIDQVSSFYPVLISTCIHTVCNEGGGEGIGGLRQINTCRSVPLLGQFLRKAEHLGFGVFIDIWSMQITEQPSVYEF
jgi:hypothetical protein